MIKLEAIDPNKLVTTSNPKRKSTKFLESLIFRRHNL